MSPKRAIVGILETLRESAVTWEGLVSLTPHGTMAGDVPELLYSDLDVIFVFDDAAAARGLRNVLSLFSEIKERIAAEGIRCIVRIESGPMHPLRSRGEGSLVPLREKPVLFCHVSVFSRSFYKGLKSLPGPSRLLLRSWGKLEPLVGRPLSSLRRVESLSVSDVLREGLGIEDCRRMLESGRRGFWAIHETRSGGVEMEWKEENLEDFEVYDLPCYSAKWAMKNGVEALRDSVPLGCVNNHSVDGWSEWLMRASKTRRQFGLLDGWIQGIQELRADYTEDPTAFRKTRPAGPLREAAVDILERVATLMKQVEGIEARRYCLDFEGTVVPIYVGSGLRTELESVVERLDPDRIAIVTDSEVGQLFDFRSFLPAGVGVSEMSVPEGERSKSPEQLVQLMEAMEGEGITAQSLLLLVGGGNVGNLGGTLAGLLCRGVSFIHVPTSLVGQLDSTISAKQSVNGWKGKNYFGLYHAPSAVLINPLLLASLPREECLSGLSEALKHGLSQSGALVKAVLEVAEQAGDPSSIAGLHAIVCETIRLKLDYMRDDPREDAPTQFLELGHKVGHALEHLTSGSISHGQCISIGMVAESQYFEDLGAAERGTTESVRVAVEALWGDQLMSLEVCPRQVAEQIGFDNKRLGEQVPFAYLKRLQHPAATVVDFQEGVIDSLADAIGRSLEAFA